MQLNTAKVEDGHEENRPLGIDYRVLDDLVDCQ